MWHRHALYSFCAAPSPSSHGAADAPGDTAATSEVGSVGDRPSHGDGDAASDADHGSAAASPIVAAAAIVGLARPHESLAPIVTPTVAVSSSPTTSATASRNVVVAPGAASPTASPVVATTPTASDGEGFDMQRHHERAMRARSRQQLLIVRSADGSAPSPKTRNRARVSLE